MRPGPPAAVILASSLPAQLLATESITLTFSIADAHANAVTNSLYNDEHPDLGFMRYELTLP